MKGNKKQNKTKQNDLKYIKWFFFLTQSLSKILLEISAFEFYLLQCHDWNEPYHLFFKICTCPPLHFLPSCSVLVRSCKKSMFPRYCQYCLCGEESSRASYEGDGIR